MTSVVYHESMGIVVTNFYANIRMYEPIMFKPIWSYEEMNLKDQTSRHVNITFTVSKYSKHLGYVAVGGLEGFIFVYNLNAKSKLGENKTVHCAEILDISFSDSINTMLTSSADG